MGDADADGAFLELFVVFQLQDSVMDGAKRDVRPVPENVPSRGQETAFGCGRRLDAKFMFQFFDGDLTVTLGCKKRGGALRLASGSQAGGHLEIFQLAQFDG